MEAVADQVPDESRYDKLVKILEALLLASEMPLSIDQLYRLLAADLGVGKRDIREALEKLAVTLESRAAELQEVASGYRIQVRRDYAEWVSRLWQEKPPKLSRALLETLALVCYRQPITRGEIEEVRGVAMSPNIIRTLLERGWIREVGQKEVPGRPSLFGTTSQFLDDFNLTTLDDLPDLPEIKDVAALDAALVKLGELPAPTEAAEAEEPAPEGAVHETAASAEAEELADEVAVEAEVKAAPDDASDVEAPADEASESAPPANESDEAAVH
ncbi:MAG: SMC-Scp complex subunit ScpB [Cupriavidus sp.]|nr:MAG: SMC-Scp complex subunit ScpB [Cupriavidus sp.]